MRFFILRKERAIIKRIVNIYLKNKNFEQARKIASSIKDSYEKDTVLFKIAMFCLKNNNIEEARRIVNEIHESYYKVRILTNIAKILLHNLK
ncbi:MAG: hypothetical protein QXL51_01140 [Candidatus Aenigmatarchaeota archaeon]